MWYRKQLTTLLPKLIHVKTIQLKRSVDVTSVLCPGMLYLCVFSTASALIPGVYFGTFSQHSVLSIGMFLSTTTGTYLGVWSLYRYIPWCVVSLQPQVHTVAHSLYNHRYILWCLLYTTSVLNLDIGTFYLQLQHWPWHLLSTTSAMSTGTYLGAFSLNKFL